MTARSIVRLPLLLVLTLVLAVSGAHAAGPCSATLTSDFRLTIPYVDVDGSFYSVVLQIATVAGASVAVELVDARIVGVPPCESPASVVSDSSDGTPILYIPSLVYGSDEYGVELTRPLLALSNILKIKTAYLREGVWIGRTNCVRTFAGTIQSASADLAFACANPNNEGAFRCIPPGAGNRGIWQLVSGRVRYSHHGVGDGSFCTTTIDGHTAFSLPVPNSARFEIIDDGDVFFLLGSYGTNQSPPFTFTRTSTCDPEHNTFTARDDVIWLWSEVTPFSKDATGLGGRSHQGFARATLSCDWLFEWIPPKK